MGDADRFERGAHVGEDGDGPTGIHVDMHEHLLARRQQRPVVTVEHLVIDVQRACDRARGPAW